MNSLESAAFTAFGLVSGLRRHGVLCERLGGDGGGAHPGGDHHAPPPCLGRRFTLTPTRGGGHVADLALLPHAPPPGSPSGAGGERPCRVAPRVYLGDMIDASTPAFLAAARVTHVINCATPAEAGAHGRPPAASACLGALDLWGYPILEAHYAEFAAFLDAALASDPLNVVLVHCGAGRNRSAALVASWAALAGRRDVREVVSSIRVDRPGAHAFLCVCLCVRACVCVCVRVLRV